MFVKYRVQSILRVWISIFLEGLSWALKSTRYLLLWMKIQPQGVVGFGLWPHTMHRLVQSLESPRIWLLQMDTISQRVQRLERADKQSCLHVAFDRQANSSCGLLGTISFCLEGLLVFSTSAPEDSLCSDRESSCDASIFNSSYSFSLDFLAPSR